MEQISNPGDVLQAFFSAMKSWEAEAVDIDSSARTDEAIARTEKIFLEN
jgi:hypothetical protein